MADQYLNEITARDVGTPRLRTRLLESNREGQMPVLLVHGNVASSRFFEETLAALPPRYRGLAPDLRGFGGSETKPVDATRGLRDFSDDLHELTKAPDLGIDGRIHLVGWSMGGGIAVQYAIDHPTEVASLTLIAPLPPYGIDGTKDAAGTPCFPDYAGGGGPVNPLLPAILAKSPTDRTNEDLQIIRGVLNNYYFKPPFRVTKEREDAFVYSMLETFAGPNNYPGERTSSSNYPFRAPGTKGIVNAISPRYCDLSAFALINPKPPVLWVRGSEDQIISDNSPLDFGRLGRLNSASPSSVSPLSPPNWPGEEVYPPQPRVSQTYELLDSYKLRGGRYQMVILDCGHSPHIEKPQAFRRAFLDFLDSGDRQTEKKLQVDLTRERGTAQIGLLL